MSSRPAVTTACFLLLALLTTGMKCGSTPPGIPEVLVVPDTVYQRAPVSFGITCSDPYERRMRFVVDWGDGTVDTSNGCSSGDTAMVTHRWDEAGEFGLRVMTVLADEVEIASPWAEPVSVTVLANGIPDVPALTAPSKAAVGAYTHFRATGTDPDGDSVSFQFDFGEAVGNWTGFVPSGSTGQDSHRFETCDTLYARCRARDVKRSESDWSDSVRLIVSTTGAVRWWWTGPDMTPPSGAPLVVLNVTGEKVYIGWDDGCLRTSDGKETGPDFRCTGYVAYCEQTGHVVVGGERGLYAFTPSFAPVWRWIPPDTTVRLEWGAPAVCGDRVYCPCDNESLYCFQDFGDTVQLLNVRRIPGIGVAVAINAAGDVIVASDSGCLYRLTSDIDSIIWQVELAPGGELYPPALGSDGMVYVSSASGVLHAVGPAGDVVWTQVPAGGARFTVVGDAAVFTGTGDGRLYSYDPATGDENWSARFGPTAAVVGSPVLSRNGYVYCQNAEDVLYCVRQSDGRRMWSCDCPGYLPDGKGRSRDLGQLVPSPGITGSGDILVVGQDALYCVAGYEDGPLADAPWPKWQHDSHNSGRSAGW